MSELFSRHLDYHYLVSHPSSSLKGGETCTNSIASIFAWSRGLAHRAKLDDDARLLDFTEKLEAACIGVVESGKMTKDLALIIHGSKLTRDQYVNTEEFIDAVDEELKTRLAIKAQRGVAKA
ncbi:hypothetical protein K2173_006676 [Erythroxylum novogranatense]|uniref:Isopropylmalate dehydrogenase-like domain-containing protein n=1 Tax=Erythroxylum novogranatense TaxID=1862640 RepID=A0AAV8SXL3_9ROSI|nr:hypothetical protein K2173_006676 [Erythroxylum novogranatense]